jgi:hypothetical protein
MFMIEKIHNTDGKMFRTFLVFLCIFLMMSLSYSSYGMDASTQQKEYWNSLFDYPSPTNKNDLCIINKTIWNLFAEIGGFNNSPNAKERLVDNGGISISLNNTENRFLIELSGRTIEDYSNYAVDENIGYIRIISLTYKIFSKNNTEIKELTDSVGGVGGTIFRITAHIDGDNIHVFFSISNADLMDSTHYYYMFYSKMNLSSGNVDKIKMFYFEKIGSHLPVYQPPNQSSNHSSNQTSNQSFKENHGNEIILVICVAAIGLISIFLYMKYKSSIFKKKGGR